MFGLLKTTKKPYQAEARGVYARTLEHVRQPVFYTEYGVPDTFDGRFDLLLVHLFIVMEAVGFESERAEAFNQALFDVTFADMDQTLREMGIGDMGIPKHMRKMMKAFNGRMNVYHSAIGANNDAFVDALKRNLYAGAEGMSDEVVARFAQYCMRAVASMKALEFEVLQGGAFQFKD